MANTSEHSARDRFARAVQFARAGDRQKAIELFEGLIGTDAPQVQVLSALIRLNLDEGHLVAAADYMMNVATRVPEPAQILADAADIYGRADAFDKADVAFEKLHKELPGYATGYFNHGFLLRSAGRFEDALKAYDQALALNIDGPEEVWLNKAVIYSDHLRQDDRAEQCLQSALKINPTYVPALLNYANLHEERSNRDAAAELYRRVADIAPGNAIALARLLNLSTATEINDGLLANATTLAKVKNAAPREASSLNFALGKAHDARGHYNKAFKCYQTANRTASSIAPPYDRNESDAFFAAIRDTFSTHWFKNLPVISDAQPTFICGMFRSGSTLIEQVIAAHPDATPGGELEYFVSLVSRDLAPFPASITDKTAADLTPMADAYISLLENRFGNSGLVTDKRPDNFLYIGLIKTLFPNARFIHTTRHPLDNCLSVYFLELADSMAYARNLLDIGHYYVQQHRLMAHWKALFPDDIFEMHYDTFVETPRDQTKALLEFLGLPWHEGCLEFHKLRNTVKTVSYWQVRESLYTRSSGRHKHYDEHLALLRDYLAKASLL